MSGKRVALALGSGGARGYAHIGAIQALMDNGYQIVAVSGTSMGALIGALQAVGQLDEFTTMATALTRRDVIRLLDPAFGTSGLIRADKVMQLFGRIVGDVQIQDLPIAYTAVATDLLSRRQVWFQRGPLEAAVRASIAIPLVFTPVTVDGRLLVDGALLNPLPIEPMAAVPADLTVAVSLTALREGGSTPVKTTAQPQEPRSVRTRWIEGGLLGEWWQRWGRDSGPLEPSFVEMLSLSLETVEAAIGGYRLAGNPPEVFVGVPSDTCQLLDFHRASEVIEVGRQLTQQALERAGL